MIQTTFLWMKLPPCTWLATHTWYHWQRDWGVSLTIFCSIEVWHCSYPCCNTRDENLAATNVWLPSLALPRWIPPATILIRGAGGLCWLANESWGATFSRPRGWRWVKLGWLTLSRLDLHYYKNILLRRTNYDGWQKSSLKSIRW